MSALTFYFQPSAPYFFRLVPVVPVVVPVVVPLSAVPPTTLLSSDTCLERSSCTECGGESAMCEGSLHQKLQRLREDESDAMDALLSMSRV